MLKVVVFDSGMGGECFAEKLQSYLPVLQIIKVIDWRHAAQYLRGGREARRCATRALRPYIGQVDLIIFANYYLTITNLKHFQRKFKTQLFTGLSLKLPDTFRPRPTIVMTTNAVAKTINYRNYAFRIRRPITTLCLDDWVDKIDEGEMNQDIVKMALDNYAKANNKHHPDDIVIACAHFNDIVDSVRYACGKNVKIYDGFDDCYRNICHLLKIRGGLKKMK